MALNKQDLLELKKAKENGLNLDQIIESVENKVSLNELKEKLQNIGNEIYYNFNGVVEKNILEIAKIGDSDKMLNFIIKKSYEEYKKEQEKREKEKLQEIEQEKKMREDLEKEKNTEKKLKDKKGE